MARGYTITTIDFDDYASDYIGVSQDNYLNEDSPSSNYAFSQVRVGKIVNYQHGIWRLKMPEKEDIENLDQLLKVELVLYMGGGTSPYSAVLGLIEIQDIWDENQSSWNEAQTGVDWKAGVGAIKTRMGSIEEGETVIDSVQVGSIGWKSFDITPIASLGSDITLVMFPINLLGGTTYVEFMNREAASLKPIIRLTYKDISPDVFKTENDQLTIEPNSDNPEQPKLSWGGTDDTTFSKYRLWRDTSPITSVSALTPIFETTDPTEISHIDDDSLVDGTTYYYLVTCEDGLNTGNKGTFSKNVSFTKPDVASASLSPSGAQDVGTAVTLTVTSGRPIKMVYVDWKDGTQSWYVFDITGTSKTVQHVYDATTSGAVTPDVRVEDNIGFWSSLTPTSNTITLNDVTPSAKLLVNVKRDHVGVEVTLNAALSQPAGSNVTIINYKFKRYAGDSWNDNGSNPIFSFSTTGFSVGVKTASVLITTSTSLNNTTTVDYELEAGDPVELEFSRNTRIHEYQHGNSIDKEFRPPLEGDGVEYQFKTAKRAERVTIHGTSHTPDMASDIAIVRDLWDNDTYFRVRVKNEVEGKDVLYDGKLESDVSIGHSYPNLQTWSFNMVVFNRTEV